MEARTLIIRLTLAMLIMAGLIATTFFFVGDNSDEKEPSSPIGTNTQFPIGADRVVSDDERNIVTELITDSGTTDLGGGSYLISGSAVPNETEQYQILYYEPDQSYMISLIKKPLRVARLEAEAALKQRFGWDDTEICTKPVMVTVAYDTDQTFSGRNLGVSMCPGSVELP